MRFWNSGGLCISSSLCELELELSEVGESFDQENLLQNQTEISVKIGSKLDRSMCVGIKDTDMTLDMRSTSTLTRKRDFWNLGLGHWLGYGRVSDQIWVKKNRPEPELRFGIGLHHVIYMWRSTVRNELYCKINFRNLSFWNLSFWLWRHDLDFWPQTVLFRYWYF